MRAASGGLGALTLRGSQILLVVIAILAFVPVLGVDYVLGRYVKAHETEKMQSAVNVVSNDAQRIVHGAIQSLRTILRDSPSLCTPTFMANVNSQLQSSLFLTQVVVENSDGVQYCSAYDSDVRYRVLSESLAIPGYTERLSAVVMEGNSTPMLKVTQHVNENRSVSAFVVPAPILLSGYMPVISDLSYLQIAMTNGTPIVQVGDERELDGQGGDFLIARSFAGEIPLRTEAAVSLSSVRARYSELTFAFTVIACLIGAITLALAIQYARRSKMPAYDIERAIVAGEMKPYYQPVINLRTGRLTGCEVLIRWVKRNGEVIPPGAFIDYAEMTNLAIPMTLNLMEQVRDDLEGICREVRDFKVSINLFEGHFRDGSIVDDIQSIFEGSGISYEQLVFEITERRPLDDRAAVNRIVSAMHALGVRVAMDDVGTGHSNLAYLHTLGIDIIKIDKIFVDMIKDANVPVPVIDGLVSMARDMGIEIIAEGVETQDQALYLRSKNVTLAQGYLFSPPLKLDSFLTLANALKPQVKQTNLDEDIAA